MRVYLAGQFLNPKGLEKKRIKKFKQWNRLLSYVMIDTNSAKELLEAAEKEKGVK